MRKALPPEAWERKFSIGIHSEPDSGQTYGTCSLWIIVVTMNREHGDGDIQILIFIVDGRETEQQRQG